MVPRQVEAGTDPELGVHVHEVSATVGAQNYAHDQEHELLFDTWTYIADAPLQSAPMRQILMHLPSTVFRVKGFVYAIEEPESRVVVQLVGRRAKVTPTCTWGTEQPQTRLVFISRHGAVDYPAVEKAMNSCRMVKDESTT